MSDNNYHIEVSIRDQRLRLMLGDKTVQQFDVSTARLGAGEVLNSECTPRGSHEICEMFGQGCEPGTVFVGRKPTGEIYTPILRKQYPERDWILSRILRLQGTEPGFNYGGDVDSYQRMIYIHGSPDDVEMGMPGSHGCIRMRNVDVISLFDMVSEGTAVIIHE